MQLLLNTCHNNFIMQLPMQSLYCCTSPTTFISCCFSFSLTVMTPEDIMALVPGALRIQKYLEGRETLALR